MWNWLNFDLEAYKRNMGLKFERVAVIGAGVSGLAAARHLIDYGLDVTIYERSSRPGGVW